MERAENNIGVNLMRKIRTRQGVSILQASLLTPTLVLISMHANDASDISANREGDDKKLKSMRTLIIVM